jgi:hypothetical protein
MVCMMEEPAMEAEDMTVEVVAVAMMVVEEEEAIERNS